MAQPWWYKMVGVSLAKPKPVAPSAAAQKAIRRNERKMRLYCVPKRAA